MNEMPRYIDADALLKHLCNGNPSAMEDYYYNAIKNAPKADVVEVVRCKDCKFYLSSNKQRTGCCEFDEDAMEKYPSHYCSYGERKEK